MASPASTPTLAALERWLVSASTDAGEVTDAEAEAVVTPGPRLSARERVAIYRDGYAARLVECLADDYPALKFALGDAEFERVARAYVAAHPSRSRSLNAYGAAMPGFLRARPDAGRAFASDLARLEWALVEVVHAETKPPLAADALRGLGPEDFARATLVASPALRVLRFDYPVNRFYQAFCVDGAPDLPAPEASAVAAHRSGLSVYRLELEPPMRVLLAALTNGETLARALAALERELSPEELGLAQERVSEWFGAWIASGFFTALAVG